MITKRDDILSAIKAHCSKSSIAVVQTSATVPASEWRVRTVTLVPRVPLDTNAAIETRVALALRMTIWTNTLAWHHSNPCQLLVDFSRV